MVVYRTENHYTIASVSKYLWTELCNSLLSVTAGVFFHIYQYLDVISELFWEWSVGGVSELHTHFQTGPACCQSLHQHRETVWGWHTDACLETTNTELIQQWIAIPSIELHFVGVAHHRGSP